MSEVIDFKIRWGMVIDLDKCTGCGACMVACQAENNLAPQVDASNKLRALNWLTVYRLSNGKSFPDHEVAYLPRPCMAVRQAVLRQRVPCGRHRQARRRRNRQPDSSPLHRLPVLHGLVSLPCPLL